MARTSLVHYISPSAITIIPNCNGTADDLAVQVATGTKIRVYSKAVGLDLVNATYQEWTLKGRNRRLLGTDTNCRYTIFARLSKANVADGYVVFTPMTEETEEGGTTVGVDKYWHVTAEGYSRYEDNRLDEDFDPDDPTLPDDQRDYWWFRIGWVTKPADGLRSVYLDTGILGTEEGDETNIEEMLKKKYVTIDWFKRIFSIHGTDGKRIPKEWDESGKPVDWWHKKDEETGLDTDEYVYEGQQYDPETGELVRRDIEPNDMDHEITDTESMFGTWTQQFLSALGIGSGSGGGGGQGGDGLEDPLLSINNAGLGQPPTPGTGKITIVYNYSTGRYEWGTAGGGLSGLTLKDGNDLITPTGTDDNLTYNLGAKFLSLTHGGTVLGDVIISGATLTIPTRPQGFTAGDNDVLTKKETETLFADKYVTTEFFKKLFRAQDASGDVNPNDMDATITSIKLMFGTWTEQYLSALGIGSSGGSGGGTPLNDPLMSINGLEANPSAQQIGYTLVWKGHGQGTKGTGWAYEKAGLDATQMATELATYSWWGRQFTASSKIISGDIENAGDITFQASGKNIGGLLYFNTTGGCLGVNTGNLTPGYTLHVNGYAYASRIYLAANVYLEYDNNGGVRLNNAGFYADTFVSALGTGSTGGGLSLNELLMSLNGATIVPTGQANKVLVNTNGNWRWEDYGGGTPVLRTLTISDGTTSAVTYNPASDTQAKTLTVSGEKVNNTALVTVTANGTAASLTVGLASNYGDTKNPYASKTAKYVLAAPSDQAGAPEFRQLSAAYLSDLSLNAQTGVITIGSNTITPLTDATLKSGYKWWGQAMKVVNQQNVVTGSMTDVGSITMSGNIYMDNSHGLLVKKTTGNDYYDILDYNANEDVVLGWGVRDISETYICGQTIQLAVYYEHETTHELTARSVLYAANNGNVGIGITPSATDTKLYVNGNIRTSSATGSWIQIGQLRLIYEESGGNKFLRLADTTSGGGSANFYATGAVSALGMGSTGSASTFDEDQMWTALGGTMQNKTIANSHLKNLGTLKIQIGSEEDEWDPTVTGQTVMTFTGGGGGFEMKEVTASTLDTLSGTFGFYGNNLIDNHNDWVGLQMGVSNDKWQLTADGGHLKVRQEDNGGTSSSNWTAWHTVIDDSGGTMKGTLAFGAEDNTTYMDLRFYRNNHMSYIAEGTDNLTIAYRPNPSNTNTNYSLVLSENSCAVSSPVYSGGGRLIGPIAAGSYNFNFADGLTTGGIYQVHSGYATKNSSWPFDYGVLTNFVSTNGHLQIAASDRKNDIYVRSYWWTGSSSFGNYPEWQTLIHSGNIGSYLGSYLPLDGSGTMTGTLYVATGKGVTNDTGDGLLVYHPTTWTGISSSQWGVGAINCQGVIRSDYSNLVHYKGGTNYNILDASNGVAKYSTEYGQNGLTPASVHGYWAAMTTQSGITSDWWHILHMDWQHGANWRSELALPTQDRKGVYYRSDKNVNGTWTYQPWVLLLDTTNGVTLDTEQTITGKKTFSGVVYIDLATAGSTVLGTQYPVIESKYKNAAGAGFGYYSLISLIGSGETSTCFNMGVRLGSQNGMTWLSAGESGATLSSVLTSMCNTENVYISADNNICMITGASNDSASYTIAMDILSNGNVGIGTSNPGAKLDVSGSLRASSFLTSWNATGSNGTIGFVHIATITVASAWASMPLKFRVTQRGRMGGELTVRFLNANSAAGTSIDQFFYTGDIAGASIVQSGTTFSLYIRKAEGYDNIGITLVDYGAYAAGNLSVAWANSLWTYPTGSDGNPDTSATPGSVNATCRYYFAGNVYMEYDTVNKGVRVYNSGLYADTYVSSLGAGSTGQGGATNLLPPLDAINNLGTPTFDKAVIMYEGNGWKYRQITSSGTVESVAMNVPTGFTIGIDTAGNSTSSGAITKSGRFYLGFASDYSLPKTSDQTKWTEAYNAKHSHSNKTFLDGLTSISGTFWGRRWSNGGTLSGTMDNVTWIDSLLYFDTDNSGVAIGYNTVADWNRSFKLRVNGDMQVAHVETTSFGGEKTDTWTDANNNKHLWYGYDHRYGNTGVYSTSFSDYFGMTFHTQSGWLCMSQAGNVSIGATAVSTFTNGTGTTVTPKLYVSGHIGASDNVFAHALELYSSTPYIDFHYGSSTADYTSRIIEQEEKTSSNAHDHYYLKLFTKDSEKTGLVVGSGQTGDYIKIGGAKIIWDNANQALHIDKGVYSDSFVSSLGMGSSGGSGGGAYIPLSGSSDITGTLAPSSSGTSLGTNQKRWDVYSRYGYFTSLQVTNAISTLGVTTLSGNSLTYSEGTINRLHVGALSSDTTHFLYVNGGSSLFNGRVGVGGINTDTKTRLYVSGKTNINGRLEVTNLSFDESDDTIYMDTSDEDLYLQTGAGTPYYSTAWRSSSDIRKKDVDSFIELSIEDVARAPLFNFRWKNSKGCNLFVGTSAQYWENILRNAVSVAPDGYLAMDYSATALAAAITTARKVLTHEEQIAALTSRLDAVEQENKAIKAENKQMRNEIELLKAA